ncbi:hypothetical protein TTHERM_00488180 (macronuclear) [Tetrahymena thermophila SB210]|uniref:Transmembrane protein n=1 Tax=Tetrahymena thermophila (strain SB210) TaxID=312017 RepID=Q23JF6_TETTS|nr:hypothetical protein TTHERM_00488180 [Tetrahymena thermophila SB210]EAR96548.1 hypothetical protein TTHERM_00488180 [Tetrahymena thermophila SB210]|eukprot:XP_001016793.1 hypothetical protein TTHERM_00488180 [Tetrahymena thermophila SB210]
MSKLLFSIFVFFQLASKVLADVDIKIYNLKYRISVQGWLTEFQPQQDGFDVCLQLEGACCFFYNQTITPTLTTFKGQKAIQFQGKAQGYSPQNCYNNQLTILVIGSNGDQDLTSTVGQYTYVSDINSSTGQLYEGAKFQFVLDIDDQQSLYVIKLPCLSNTYGDNSSYNQLQVLLPSTTLSQIKQVSLIALLIVFSIL